MPLFVCIWTLLNDLFQSENKVFKPTSLLVLLHCGMGKDWASPIFPPSKMFRSFYLSFSFFDYGALSWHLNTYEWPVSKRESSFQTKQFICTATLWVGERLGRPILSPHPSPNKMFRSFFLSFSLLDYATPWPYLNTVEWPILRWKLSFQTNKFIGTSTLTQNENFTLYFF